MQNAQRQASGWLAGVEPQVRGHQGGLMLAEPVHEADELAQRLGGRAKARHHQHLGSPGVDPAQRFCQTHPLGIGVAHRLNHGQSGWNLHCARLIDRAQVDDGHALHPSSVRKIFAYETRPDERR
jgi:hypothetical protein